MYALHVDYCFSFFLFSFIHVLSLLLLILLLLLSVDSEAFKVVLYVSVNTDASFNIFIDGIGPIVLTVSRK